MKILLDENLPHELRHYLPGHDAATVHFMGWRGTKNGVLLQLAARDGFDALLTLDDGMEYQQNTSTLPLAVLIFSAPSNDIVELLPLLPDAMRLLALPIDRAVYRVPQPRP